MNNRAKGTYYEGVASEYLCSQGFRILERNYRCRMGEIDLVCKDGSCLVFVEVKYRTTQHQGGAFMAVDKKKQHRISRVAAYYLLEHGLGEWTPCRFDVVAIDGDEIALVRNAFEYC